MQKRSSGPQGLVFGGLMAALIVVFSLVPILSVFMPIPLVLVYVRYGGRNATLTAIVSVLFTMAFSGAVAGLLSIPSGILPGLVFGYGFRHQKRPLSIGVLAVLVSFVGWGLGYGVMRVAMFNGNDPIAMTANSEEGRQVIRLVIKSLELQLPANPTPQQQPTVDFYRGWISDLERDPAGVTWTLLPSSLFLLGAINTWLNWMLCRWTLPRFGHPVPAPTPFAEFRLRPWFTWVYAILFLVMNLLPLGKNFLGAPWWIKMVINVVPPLGLIFVMAGMAAALGYLRQRGMGKGASAALVLGGFLLGNIAVQFYLLLAMWDSIFDFRHLEHGSPKPPEENS